MTSAFMWKGVVGGWAAAGETVAFFSAEAEVIKGEIVILQAAPHSLFF